MPTIERHDQMWCYLGISDVDVHLEMGRFPCEDIGGSGFEVYP
jgi:hypothetical protein